MQMWNKKEKKSLLLEDVASCFAPKWNCIVIYTGAEFICL